MNIGGDPGRDDYGLPPVDIEIPDDARELDRDVQAYHRELRALRWRRRTRRLVVPLSRDGMVLPLLAGCLALTLLAGTLLTVFSGEPDDRRRRGPVRPPAPRRDRPGRRHGRQPLSTPAPASVLALVPPGCRCAPTCASSRPRRTRAGVRALHRRDAAASRSPTWPGRPAWAATHAVEDTEGVLSDTYHPATLTAVLVDRTARSPRSARDRGQRLRSWRPRCTRCSPASRRGTRHGDASRPAAAGGSAPPRPVRCAASHVPRVGLLDTEESTP